MTSNADQIAYWNEVAGARWVRNQEMLDRVMEPLGQALIAAAAPTRGERILDVGCGCGTLALRLAEVIGRESRIDAIDVSRPMLGHAAARAHATEGDHAPIRWIEADAAGHAFEPTFDLVVSRFGVMFFADPDAAFANLRRALKPGGRFAALAWRRRREVDWMQTPLDWLAPLLPMPEPSDGAPGPFGLADAEATRTLLTQAGFDDVTSDRLDDTVTVGRTLEEALALLLQTGPAAGALREAPADVQEEAERRLRDNLRTRIGADGGVRMNAACWIYEGRVE